MAIDFRNVIDWAIPEGNCIRVYDSTNTIIWQKETYTDMDYISCKDAYTGIIVPVSIPVGSTYDISIVSKVTSRPTTNRHYTMVMGGTNTTNSQKYGWGFGWGQYFYNGTTSYGPWNVESVYWNGWPNQISSNLFSSNNIAINTDTQLILKNNSRWYSNITDSYSRTYSTAANWNSSTAVDGWYGFGLLATGESTWDTTANQRFIGDIYSAYIKVDGVLIYSFKPVMRDRDGVYGLYDTVNNVFYPSCTSNPFTHEVITITGLTVNSTYVGLGKSKAVGCTISPANATNKKLTWTSSNTSIATINANGIATGKALGTCTATASTQDGSDLTSSNTITVYKPVQSVNLDKYSAVIGVGDSITITATVSPDDAEFTTVTWSGGNSTYMTMSTSGNTATITGKAVSGSASYAVTATCDGEIANCYVKVVEGVTHVEDVTLNTNAITLERSDTRKLTATVSPSDASNTNVTWSSSDTLVATVDSSGNVTAIDAGTCTIYASSDDNGLYDSCIVTVPTHRLTINTTPSDASVTFIGYTTQNNYIDVAKGITIDYVVSKSGYKSVSGSYTMGSSDHTVNVTLESGTQLVTGITLNQNSAIIESGTTLQLTASVSPTNASDQTITWSTTNQYIAQVDSSGLVTGVGNGTCAITCTANDGSGVSATCNVTVYGFDLSDGQVTITSLGGTSSIFGTLSPSTMSITGKWVSSNTDVATVTNNTNHTLSGREWVTITATGTGTAMISFESASLTTPLNLPVCAVTVDIPITGNKTVTLYNNTSDTIYYDKDSAMGAGLAAGTSTSVLLEIGNKLYISKTAGSSDIGVLCSSPYNEEEHYFEFDYSTIVDGDDITIYVV